MALASDELVAATKTASLEDEAAVESAPRNPAFSQPTKKNHKITDITKEFSEACSALRTAQLIKDDSFTLFESVQALEIMDPKMDSGFLEPGETHEYTFDVSQSLRMNTALGIMDKILGYWVAWQQGWPLAQNVLTCLYIDNLLTRPREHGELPIFEYKPRSSDPESKFLITKVIWVFCLGAIKLIQAELELVQSHLYYEEEDLNTHTFQLDLLSDIPDTDIVTLMNDTGHELLAQKFGNQTLRVALNVRLSFVFTALSMYGLPDCDLGSYDQILDLKWLHYKDLEATHPLAAGDVDFAFSSKVQRRLGSTAPPRPIVDLEFDTVRDHIDTAFDRDAQIIHFAQKVKDVEMQHIVYWIWRWGLQVKTPSAISRAILQSTLFDDGGVADMSTGMTRLVITDLQKHVMVHEVFNETNWLVEVPSAAGFQHARKVEYYLNQVTPLYQNMMRALCQNPCRIRRCLGNIQTEFDEAIDAINAEFFKKDSSNTLQDMIVDASIQFQNMVDRVKFWRNTVQTWTIGLGFKLELYLPYEFAGLYNVLGRTLHEMQHELSEWIRQAHDSQVSVPVGINWGIPSRSPDSEDMTIQSKYLKVLWKLSLSLSLVFAILARYDSRFVAPEIEFGERDFQIEARLRPFLGMEVEDAEIRDEEIQTFKDPWRLHNTPTKFLLKSAADNLGEAKTLLSGILKGKGEVELLFGTYNVPGNKTFLTKDFKDVVTTSVLVGSLQKGLQKYDDDDTKLATALHIEMPKSTDFADSWFVIPKITIN